MFSDHADTVIRASSFQQATRGDQEIERVVMHTTEGKPERPDFAEDVARFFAAPGTDVSAHYVVDNNSVVGCVEEEDIAFHALGDNAESIGIELAGRASQSVREWEDAFSKAELDLAAQLVADICKRRGIPVRRLTNTQLKNRERGIVSHKQVSDVFGAGIRSDPGPNFPWGKFLENVKALVNPAKVRFVYMDGKGNQLAESAPADEGWKTELERLTAFDSSTRNLRLRETRNDGRPVLKRVKA